MEQIYAIAGLWLGLAIVSAIIGYHLRLSIALVEICVGGGCGGGRGSLRQRGDVGRQSEMVAIPGE
jgi:hypothetical protein